MKKAKTPAAIPCDKCGEPVSDKLLTIVDGPCHSCGQTMKVAYINTPDLGLIRGEMRVPASKFTEEEMEIAKLKGALLQVHYSATREESYVANTCPHCGHFSGDHYLFDDYVVPASYGHLPSQEFNIGKVCENCEDDQGEDI